MRKFAPFNIPSKRKAFSAGALLIFFIILSCSIVTDEDIDTKDELSGLKLTDIDIVQTNYLGTKTTTAKLLYDSAIHFTDSLGNVATRQVIYSLPVLPAESILKFRCGVTTSGLTYRQRYLSNGKPYDSRLFLGNTLVEFYRFFYDDSGKPNKIVTFIYAADGETLIAQSKDIIAYNNSQINEVTRFSNGEEIGVFENFNLGSWDKSVFLTGFTFTPDSSSPPVTINNPNSGSGENNCGGEFCSIFTKQNFNNGGNSSLQIRLENLIENKIFQLQISRPSTEGSRDQDTYYFHPMMLLRSQLREGGFLLPLYLYDWFSPGAQTSSSNNHYNDAVTFNFWYEP
jgi:hypothetical protein